MASSPTMSTVMDNLKTVSKRLVLSYLFDWAVIVLMAAIGGGLYFLTPYKRPFSLLDLSISYPYIQESISTLTVALVGLVAPGIIIIGVVLVLVPAPSASRKARRSKFLALKAWEMEKGLAGLALSVAMAFFISQSIKNLFGKPRPHCIDTCQPDLSKIQQYAVGGYGQSISDRWVLVSAGICTNPDTRLLDDGFRSFPCGHCVFSWSGLFYLSLFLCSKLAIAIPWSPSQHNRRPAAGETNTHQLLPLHREPSPAISTGEAQNTLQVTEDEPSTRLRNEAAAPPVYLIVVGFIPIATAIYISSTRFVQFYHFGFDIISGSIIGILSAWLAFRWYHAPIRGGYGSAWGPRSRERAFGIGFGIGGYVGPEGWVTESK